MLGKMEIHLFGCKDTTQQVANFLRRHGIDIHLVTISKELAVKNDVAGYVELSDHSESFKSIYVAKSYNLAADADRAFFSESQNLRIGFCVGWQRLIPKYLLERFSLGVHGMHGSARDLPFGKGRSPMNWAIIEGRKFFTTNLFRYSDGVDDGPVVAKSSFSINETDTAETLHYKNSLSMCHIVKNNLDDLLSGNVSYIPQNVINGDSFYPKRAPADGIVDWRDDVINIDRLVRAVAPPFFGAIAYLRGEILQIKRASVFYTDIEGHPFLKAKFGEILEVFHNKKFIVRCSGGVLIVHEYEGAKISTSDIFDVAESPYRRFNRNVYGFFDN